MNAELNNRLLGVTEKISKFQLENKDLESQLLDIANSLTNKPVFCLQAKCLDFISVHMFGKIIKIFLAVSVSYTIFR